MENLPFLLHMHNASVFSILLYHLVTTNSWTPAKVVVTGHTFIIIYMQFFLAFSKIIFGVANKLPPEMLVFYHGPLVTLGYYALYAVYGGRGNGREDSK